jgi:hypothetical protein
MKYAFAGGKTTSAVEVQTGIISAVGVISILSTLLRTFGHLQKNREKILDWFKQMFYTFV